MVLMKGIYRFLTLISVLSICGCAMIFDGKSQQIVINTNPPGAYCVVIRNGASIASIAQTPGGVNIKKSKSDIKIECSKPGYQTATYLNHSGVAGATYADIIGGAFGLIGWGVDSATGSDNKYDAPVNITLPLAPTGLDAIPNPNDLPAPAPQPVTPTQPPAIQTR